ncbi:folate family ECF transporter S component [Fructilactobacillus vespulae]|uniref:folate family ECF transporter S component n=1 Tax=Fructilactobacillus vespulae TaxID=1249630 RepID=UPI0039B61C79
MESFKRWGLRPLSVKGISYLAILMAIEIVLSRLSFGNSTVAFGFAFIAVVLIARWYGPFWAVGMSIIVDFISTMLSGQAYFIGFTFSAMLGALAYSLAFYKRPKISITRVIIVVLLVTLVVNVVLNSLWVAIIANTNFFYFLPIRVVKNLISFPIQVVIIYWILNNQTIEKMKPIVFK